MRDKHIMLRVNDIEDKKVKVLQKVYGKESSAELIRYLVDKDYDKLVFLPQNSEAENYLDKVFDYPIDQIDNLINEDK